MRIPLTNKIRKIGLILFALGAIIFLTRNSIIPYFVLLLQAVSGSSGYEALIWIYYISPILMVAGIIAFFIGGRKGAEPKPEIGKQP